MQQSFLRQNSRAMDSSSVGYLEQSGRGIPSNLLSYRSGDQLVEMASTIKLQALQSTTIGKI